MIDTSNISKITDSELVHLRRYMKMILNLQNVILGLGTRLRMKIFYPKELDKMNEEIKEMQSALKQIDKELKKRNINIKEWQEGDYEQFK